MAEDLQCRSRQPSCQRPRQQAQHSLRVRTCDKSESRRDERESTEEVIPTVRGLRRVVFLTLALIFFTLGIAGAILPGLPATPFLLLTSYFLIRTAPSLNRALLRSRWFGPILSDWQQRGGVQKHVKIKAILVVLVVVGVGAVLSAHSLSLTLALMALAGVGVFVILRLPVAR